MAHIRATMLEAAKMVHATVLGVTEHQFEPHGVSIVVVIAESHLSIHTWPEHGYAAVDVFTCGNNLPSEQVVEFISQGLEARQAVSMEVQRGLLSDSAARPGGEYLAVPVAARS